MLVNSLGKQNFNNQQFLNLTNHHKNWFLVGKIKKKHVFHSSPPAFECHQHLGGNTYMLVDPLFCAFSSFSLIFLFLREKMWKCCKIWFWPMNVVLNTHLLVKRNTQLTINRHWLISSFNCVPSKNSWKFKFYILLRIIHQKSHSNFTPILCHSFDHQKCWTSCWVTSFMTDPLVEN